MSEWISVDDRLPPRMALGYNGDYQFCMMIGSELMIAIDGHENTWQPPALPVTHWMPLPEPPK